MITSTDLMMIQFLVPHVICLSRNGFEVEIACSEVGGRMAEIREKTAGYVKAVHEVRLVRSPAALKNFQGYGDMKKVIRNGGYDVIWTNEPVMGVVTRLAARQARKHGTKVVYMVHGFHFFKGASKLDWVLYYPTERIMAHDCDMIVTINREDYRRAKTMKVKQVKYIHGIGVDTERLKPREEWCDIRQELGIPKDAFLVLSVGELNKNKNHQVIIRALGILKDPDIHYMICGKGELLDSLKELARKQGVDRQVHFLGYRTDVVDIYGQADLFAFPSYREGLGLASLEAMYCGLALLASDMRGARDYVKNGVSGFLCDPDDVKGFAGAIRQMKRDSALRIKCGKRNKKQVAPYCLDHVKHEVLNLFKEL